jgi:hypothetical protein
MTSRSRFLGLALALGCAKPLVRPQPPAFGELASYAAAVRPYAGCWAVHISEPDPNDGLAELIVLELDTTVVSRTGEVEPQALRALGRGGVRRYDRDSPPEFMWYLGARQPDTVTVAVGGLSFPGWRLTPQADSLVGRMFHFWDLGGVETNGGPVSARRVACR